MASERPKITEVNDISPSQKYADAVAALASRSANTSLYPGTSYWTLAKFLRAPFENYAPGLDYLNAFANPPVDGHNFVTTHTLTPEGASNFKPLQNVQELVCQEPEVLLNGSRLLFLHGLPSPQWLNAIGGRYRVDPEFYHRHLDFQATAGRADYFTQPTLPCGLKNTIQFRVTTIGYLQGNKSTQEELDALRLRCSEDMKEYFVPLRKDKWTLGDSVVRSFSIHDAEHWSIEQEISVYVKPNGSHWTAIIWQDNGRSLELSPKGPWNTSAFDRSEIFPVIQHNSHGLSKSNTLPTEYRDRFHKTFQSALLLHPHLFYSKNLDMTTASNDVFYALSELFAFVASSENQFLNMIGSKVTKEMDPLTLIHLDDPTIANLLHNKEVLDRHIQYIFEVIAIIQNRWSSNWPKATIPAEVQIVDATAADLLEDFKNLKARAEMLSSQCDKGMTIIMNNASIRESQRAILQAEGVAKLTRLAFIFIPLSYTASFFGMNFAELGTHLSLWIYFAVSFPIISISYIFLKWDVIGLLKRRDAGLKATISSYAKTENATTV